VQTATAQSRTRIQVKLLIMHNAFCIVQSATARATAQSKTGNFRDYVVADALPGF
jgi:hypothetical protein